MTAKDEFNKQFQEYLRILYEGRWIISIIFVVVVAGTWFYTMQQDDIYQASATIRLKRALDAMNVQSYQGLGAQDLGWGSERIIANEIRVIKSEEVSEIVVQKLVAMAPTTRARMDTFPILKQQARPSTMRKMVKSLDLEGFTNSIGLTQVDTATRAASLEVVASRVRSQVNAHPVSGLDFIEVSAQSTSPREAAIIANLVIDAYRTRNLQAARENITTARGYLESQLGDKRDSLSSAENEMRSFQESHGLINLDQESQALVQQISSFEAQREQARIELEGAEKIRGELQRQFKEVEPTLSRRLTEGSDPILKQMLSEKAELELRIQSAEYNRKNALRNRPDLEQYASKELNDTKKRYDEVKKKIEQVTTKILETGDISSNPLDYSRQLRQSIVQKDIEIESHKAKLTGLDRTLAEYNRKFETIPIQSIDFARLERRRMSFDKLASTLDQKFQEAVINEQTTMGNVDIVDRAGKPGRPVKPNRPLNLLIGVLVGLILGLGVAILLRYLDNTIRNPEDVEKLGIPVLTFIPTFGTGDKLERNESLVTFSAPQSPPSEAYRTMRTAIESALSLNGQSIVVVVTSPAPKEGKSTAIANLAVSAAHSARRVLLVDADLRRPVQHTIFEIDREPGLSNALVGEVPVNQCIKKTKIPGLHVIPCGHIPSHPAELLGSARMEKFLELVKKYYDLILIDSPPVIAMADTLVVSKYADGVALVVSADQTKILGLQKAKEMLESNNARLLGVVVNRFNANKIYYSYYRYYYQNYYYYSDDGTKKKKTRKEKRSESREKAAKSEQA
ncbi:MAG: polysaccharide biosynthesis tyrosine autokinase [Ignavibacteria bacterium]|nr:polysaccharide biosynthesis tyrosine autokinase [Ignavibacteria bacterium]